MKEFTTEELRTLVWMCSTAGARVTLKDIEKGVNPSEDGTLKRIHSISKKVYSELTDRNNVAED